MASHLDTQPQDVTAADLHAVARAFRASLPSDGEVILSRIDGLDRIGVPVVQAAWLGADGVTITGYGYGTEEVEAQVGALGELCEEVHVHRWLATAPRRTASYQALTQGGEAALDPLTLCLPAGSAYTPDLELSWVAGQGWPDGAPVWVPDEWVAAHAYQLQAAPRLIVPITNGLGAGFDLEHAVAHGVMELLQRDGNLTSYRALDGGVVIDLPRGALPEIDALRDRLEALGISPLLKLANTEFGLANVYVVGDDAGTPAFSLQVSACGEAAHPDRARALRKALLEFIGSRSRKAATHGPVAQASAVLPAEYVSRRVQGVPEAEERRALDAMVDWLAMPAEALRRLLADTSFREASRVGFADLPTAETGDSAARLDLLAARLGSAGLRIVIVDCSPSGSPVRVARVIVPGLESETMSYHRIGRRGVERLRAGAHGLIADAPRSGALRVMLRPEDEAACGGPAWLDTDRAARLIGQLYPLYRECGPFSAQRVLQARAARAALPQLDDAIRAE